MAARGVRWRRSSAGWDPLRLCPSLCARPVTDTVYTWTTDRDRDSDGDVDISRADKVAVIAGMVTGIAVGSD